MLATLGALLPASEGPLHVRPRVCVGAPTALAAGLEGMVVNKDADLFPVLSLDVGLAGARAHAGLGWPGLGGFGYHSLKVGAIRTWDEPWLAESNTTYVGIEYTISPVFYFISVGPYWSPSADDVTASLYLGLAF